MSKQLSTRSRRVVVDDDAASNASKHSIRSRREEDEEEGDAQFMEENDDTDDEQAPKPTKALTKAKAGKAAQRPVPPTTQFDCLDLDDTIPDGAVSGNVKKLTEVQKWAKKMAKNPSYHEVFGIPGPRKEADVPLTPKDCGTFVKAFAALMKDYIAIGRKNDNLKMLIFSRPGGEQSNPAATFQKYWREEFYLKSLVDGNDELADNWRTPFTKDAEGVLHWSKGWVSMLNKYNKYLNDRQAASQASKDSKPDYYELSKEDSAVSRRR